MLLRQLFDPYLAQYAYLIGCQKTGQAIIIDPERDIDRYHELAAENGLTITAVAETHIHADFVSGAQEFVLENKDVQLYLSGEGGPDWTYRWTDGLTNVTLLMNGDAFNIGNIRIEAIHTPGHTPEHMSFLITDVGGGAWEPIALATGDFLFAGDVGRPDLLESAAGIKDIMEPSARTLCSSLTERLAPYGDYLQILPGHGAGSACGKSLGAIPSTTLGYERRYNRSLKLAQADTQSFLRNILEGQPDPPLYFARMKRVNRDGIRTTGGITIPPHLTPLEFSASIRDQKPKILDTRAGIESFSTSHVTNALHIPLYPSLFSAAVGSFLTESDHIVLVVETERDVEVAVRQLYRIGFDLIVGWILQAETLLYELSTSQMPRISFASFNSSEALTQGTLIDVRTTAEHSAEHLPGSISIPFTRLPAHLAAIPKDKRVFIHCASGRRASIAAAYLCSLGYQAVLIDGSFSDRGSAIACSPT